jgi:hypothetical protein
MLSILIAGLYIIICCYESVAELMYNTADKIYDFIEETAIAQKLPNDTKFTMEV